MTLLLTFCNLWGENMHPSIHFVHLGGRGLLEPLPAVKGHHLFYSLATGVVSLTVLQSIWCQI